MPLEIETPILDNSKYEEIKRRALLRIPRYTPEWTDFNESDPGITLVELFAWLTESLFFQMNRVPERNYLKFLGLLGLELEPARPAEVQVVFTPQPGANTAPVLVGTQLGAESTKGGDSLIFETSEGLGLIRAELKDVQVFDGATFTQVSTANEQPGTGFRPFGWSPQPGAALYLGFDPGSQPTVEPVFPQVMRWHVWLPQELIAGKPLNSREISSPPEPPVQLVWEYRPRANLSRWKRLEQVADESVAFTREGKIEVRGPADPAITREGRAPQPRYWLRVRMESGAYPAGHAPLLDFLRPNVAAALNLTTVRGENLGFSLGTPGQSFQIQRTPVMKDTLQLDVLEGDATTPDVWQRVDDFLGSSPDEAHYTLNPSSGEIRFGDGQRGRIPIAGAAITAGFYRYGGGAAGNVGRGAVSSLLTAVLGVSSVTNPRSAAGGRGEESVADFLKRAPSILHHRNRAISADDITQMAGLVGGISQATAIPLFHPDHRNIEVPGAVTVVVVPDNEDVPPRPSPQELRAVAKQLEPNRLLTTELYVKGPEYHKIWVDARVEADPYAEFDEIRAKVLAEINRNLDPRKREFGKDFYPTILFNWIQSVPNVKAVSYLAIRLDGQPRKDLNKAVILQADELLYGALDHDIRVVPYKEQ